MKQGSQNRLKFTLDLMKKTFTSLMDKAIPEFPKEVSLNLPKLKKVGDVPELPKIKLPKVKKVEAVVEGVSQ